jgi:hypothetical protein
MYIILIIFLLLLIVNLSYNKKQQFFRHRFGLTSQISINKYINSSLNYWYIRPKLKKRHNNTYRSKPLYIGEHKYYSFMK